MKKIFLMLGVACVLFTSCDPLMDKGDFDTTTMTSESLLKGATFAQFKAITDNDGNVTYEPSETGNYIQYNFPSVSAVTVYYEKKGERKTLSYGRAGGMVYYLPSRGSEPKQNLYFSYINQDGQEVVASKEFTLDVAQALDPAMKVLVSDKGTKKWKWMPTNVNNGAVWGNGDYPLGVQDGSLDIRNAWWGCGVNNGDCPNKFSDQQQHAGTKYNDIEGECYDLSYMEFNEDGTLTVYSDKGVKISEGSFSISNYKNNDITNTDLNSRGTLETSAGAILWPFTINTDGAQPTKFEIGYLDAGRMILFCEGKDGEATWWSFMSDDDPSILTLHDWHWRPTEVNGGAVWGNGEALMGPIDGTGAIQGAWWGCGVNDGSCKDTFAGQMQHAGPSYVAGEEFSSSKMVFNEEQATITVYDKDGKKIREGSYSIDLTPNPERNSIGTLTTSEGLILWPFAINANGFQPTTFEIGYMSSEALVLIYTRTDAGESTWWSFGK